MISCLASVARARQPATGLVETADRFALACHAMIRLLAVQVLGGLIFSIIAVRSSLRGSLCPGGAIAAASNLLPDLWSGSFLRGASCGENLYHQRLS